MTTSTNISLRYAVALLTLGRFTRAEFSQASRSHPYNAGKFITALHQAKAIHIDEWIIDARGCSSIAVFAPGPGKDAPKKPPRARGPQRVEYDRARRRAIANAALSSALHKMVRSAETTEEV